MTNAVNMNQRAVMQYLSLVEWKRVSHLPVPAGLRMLDRTQTLGWIELRGMEPQTEIRLTPLGRKRCGHLFDDVYRLVEMGLKAKK
jgi:hypothetical protein